jgi:RND superfamily putative drug exporter
MSFALTTLIPLSTFRELGSAVALGVLIDAIVVRSFLVPALISLAGPVSGWPGKGLVVRSPSAPTGHPTEPSPD